MLTMIGGLIGGHKWRLIQGLLPFRYGGGATIRSKWTVGRPHRHLTRQTKSRNPNLPKSWHKSTLTDLSLGGVVAADGGSRAILMTRISDEFVSAAWARMRARQGHQTSRNLSWPITSLQIFLGSLACLVTLTSAGPRYSSRIVETKTGSIRGVILELHTKHLEPVEVRRNGWRLRKMDELKLNYNFAGIQSRPICSAPGGVVALREATKACSVARHKVGRYLRTSLSTGE